MIDDVELRAVQWIRQESDQGFAAHRIAGLDGVVHQRLGRRSHQVVVSGLLIADTAADDLTALQEKAAAGEEVTFTADITTALEVEKMVIGSLAAEQTVGAGGQYAYTIQLVESPPLPPPAELSPFGGLGEFGLGDLGFDAGMLEDLASDLADQAGAITDALDSALDAVQAVTALGSLADLGDVSNPLRPVSDQLAELSQLGTSVVGVMDDLNGLLP